MPRIRPDDYLDYDDEDSLDIQEDEPTDKRGRRVQPKQIPKQDRDWEEARRALIHRKYGRDRD